MNDSTPEKAQLEHDVAALAVETRQHLELLIDAVVDYAIFMLDREGNILSWNPGAQRIKGYAREEIMGQHFSRFYTEADRKAEVPKRALAAAT